MNTFITRLYVMLQTFGFQVRGRMAAPARGANFIEYALLAVIAVIIFYVFREALTGENGIIGKLLGRLTGAVDESSAS